MLARLLMVAAIVLQKHELNLQRRDLKLSRVIAGEQRDALKAQESALQHQNSLAKSRELVEWTLSISDRAA